MGHEIEGPAEEEPVFNVWPEHAKALDIFLKCSTQWRVIAGMGGAVFQGIDYTALKAVIDLFCDENPRELFTDVCHIERGALTAYKEQQSDGKK
ncbi:MAG: hypothetical protein CMI54_02710 [Parcubacteria group bacterium]|jgi:hypothetical protein|nr:hypothetical protein [Parcubacteria group bacterium]|tara:strand:+ start:5874 stop:6155 length:282 start_codon:yes stop_codon:yes gene_type:complete